MRLPDLPLTVLDTETTGFIPKVHRVMEFASMRVEEGKIVDRYEQLFGVAEIPPIVAAITHIHQNMLQGQPSFEEKRDEVVKHIGTGGILVGQNLGFDIGMLKGEGIDLTESPWIDTSMLASLVFPELPSFSLGYLSEALKLNHTPKHRAMGDVVATLELLGQVWERLLELPEARLEAIREVFSKSSAGYKMLFAALPKGTAKKDPEWMSAPHRRRNMRTMRDADLSLPRTGKGELALMEEPLDPLFVGSLIEAARKDSKTKHVIAVKNLDALLSRVDVPRDDKELRVAFAPFQILDAEAAERLLAQESFTADEATLAVKIRWFSPVVRRDISVHGGEEQVWNGKLAATIESKAYRSQFSAIPSTMILDHRELLSAVTDEEHPAHKKLEDLQIIIDDASMLEDTATKAYGWECKVENLRAAAANNPGLTKFVDLLAIWIERVRQFQSIRYLVKSDLTTPETSGLKEQAEAVLKAKDITPQLKKNLTDLLKILDPENLPHRIVWMEQWQDGALVLSSVPESIGLLLKEDLLSKTGAVLLIPQGTSQLLPEILPPGFRADPKQVYAPKGSTKVGITFDPELDLPAIVLNPPPGKSIVLAPSKGVMEMLFIKHAEELEEKGITLVCQGVSGGQGRMQAEFEGAKAPAVWLMTPWSFEGIDLPDGTVDHLFIKSLPFDHPSNTILSRRAQHFGNAFTEYLMPRLLHRLFRLLRTFSRFRSANADITVMDERIFSKDYGKAIKRYLDMVAGTEGTDVSASAKPVTKPAEKMAAAPKPAAAKKAAPKKMVKKKANDAQLPLL
jgi:DNA polymerase III epsilon subunit-like protein